MIRGGLRANLDADEAEELLGLRHRRQRRLVCGGAFRWRRGAPQRQPTSDPQLGGGAYVEPIDQRFACVIGDIDNDQRDDLVVLAGKQNGFPSLVLHRGTGDAQVFRAQGERLTWAERELRNTSPRHAA